MINDFAFFVIKGMARKQDFSDKVNLKATASPKAKRSLIFY